MRVYILSTYEEHGAEYVRASTSKDTIKQVHLDLCDKYIKEAKEVNYTQENLDILVESIGREAIKLQQILLLDEVTPDNGIDLSNGWGGFQLHIIELE